MLLFLKDSKNQAKKEGIHGIQNVKLVSIELSTDPQFTSQGDYVYDVLLDMKVNKASEFYMNGVTRHIFVLKMTSDGLKIETVYFKGLADKENGSYNINLIPMDPEPRPIPTQIKLYDTSQSVLKTLNFNTYIKDVMPNEIYVTWSTESLKANILAAKTYAWYNIENPRTPATIYNAHVTDQWTSYQHYKEGSNHPTTNNLVDLMNSYIMVRGQGPFDAQYRAGTQGVIGTQDSGELKQWGTVVLANNGYKYYEILDYYYTNMVVVNYYPYPNIIM